MRNLVYPSAANFFKRFPYIFRNILVDLETFFGIEFDALQIASHAVDEQFRGKFRVI